MTKLRVSRIRPIQKQRRVFSADEELFLAQQLKALAHPVRLQILQSLGDRNNCCCNDICAGIPLAQSTVSQHLKILNNVGIIDYQSAGNCSHYSINATVLSQTIAALSKLGEIAGNTETCGWSKDLKQQLRDKKKPNKNMDNQ